MDNREIAKYNCFNSICSFGDAHTDTFPAAGFAGGLFTQMKQIVVRLEALDANQVSASGASRQSTISKSAARGRLTATLDALNLAANAMGLTTPGFETKFRRPRERTDQALLSSGRAFLEDAHALEAEFIKYGLSADFLAELGTEIADFEHAASEHQNHAQASVSATTGVDETIDEGLMLRHQLNAIVRNTLRDDRALLAAWQNASHIEHPGRKQGGSKPPTPPAPSSDSPEKSE